MFIHGAEVLGWSGTHEGIISCAHQSHNLACARPLTTHANRPPQWPIAHRSRSDTPGDKPGHVCCATPTPPAYRAPRTSGARSTNRCRSGVQGGKPMPSVDTPSRMRRTGRVRSSGERWSSHLQGREALDHEHGRGDGSGEHFWGLPVSGKRGWKHAGKAQRQLRGGTVYHHHVETVPMEPACTAVRSNVLQKRAGGALGRAALWVWLPCAGAPTGTHGECGHEEMADEETYAAPPACGAGGGPSRRAR